MTSILFNCSIWKPLKMHFLLHPGNLKRSNSSNFWMIAFAVIAVLYASSPKPLGELKYEPMRHEVAPLKDVLAKWATTNSSNILGSSIQEFKDDELVGPESIAFDPQGRGPYTGLADGRIVRYVSAHSGWETFAVPSVNWTNRDCMHGNKTSMRIKNEHICGRPLGLRFNKRNGDLFIADSYYGLLVVGPRGGVATRLSAQVDDGTPILFANDLDLHPNGSIFFTDTSTRWNRRLHHMSIIEGENTGRLLRYDPNGGKAIVVLKGLAFPNGVQISRDQSFILVVETTNCRILRYWLEGELKGTKEVFADLPGYPDNVRMNDKGEFWVAIDCCRNRIQEMLSARPWLKSIIFRLPLPLSWIMYGLGEKMYSIAALFDSEHGNLLISLEDRQGQAVKLISEIQHLHNKLWFGTVLYDRIATFHLDKIKSTFNQLA